MNAPTVWEEGRWSAARVTRLSVFASTVLMLLDLVVTGRLGHLFDAGFAVLFIGLALAIRPGEFFRVGVLPPILLLGLCSVLSVLDRGAVAGAQDSLIQAVITGLAYHSGPLLITQALTLAVLATRQRVLGRHGKIPETHVWDGEPIGHRPYDRLDELLGLSEAEEDEDLDDAADYSNLDGSPAPYRTISGDAEVKSTTVVGSEPHSPESMTASNS